MPLMRAMSMEHRWQDLANFLNLPDGAAAAAAAAANLSSHPGHPHHHHHHPYTGHHVATGHPHHSHHPAVHSPFAHPGYPGHPHSPHQLHHNNTGAYGVHSAAAAAAAHHHHHHHHGYGGLAPAAATPISAYPNSANAANDATGRTAVLLQNTSVGSPLTELGGNGSYPSSSLGKKLTKRYIKVRSLHFRFLMSIRHWSYLGIRRDGFDELDE